MFVIGVSGRSYAQTYPQKLGRGFCGNNIADSSREKAVYKPVLRLSNDFPGDRSGIGNFSWDEFERGLLLARLLFGGLRWKG